jgi:hypothetical protein
LEIGQRSRGDIAGSQPATQAAQERRSNLRSPVTGRN